MSGAALRIELKAWERDFAIANSGRKPQKDDIKQNAYISAKYEQYHDLRRTESQAAPFRSPSRRTAATPKKEQPAYAQLSPHRNTDDESMVTPAALRKFLGPTPRRNGQVLGLFDDIASPIKGQARNALIEVDINVAMTPRRKEKRTSPDTRSSASKQRASKTPTSAGQRFVLDSFATPSKRLFEGDVKTPVLARETPAFLRRSAHVSVNDLDAQDDEHGPRKRQKKGLARSLSSILQNLRNQAEEQHDEELDILRELETQQRPDDGMLGITGRQTGRSEPDVLVEDSQTAMPLGPDGDSSNESAIESDDQIDEHGNPRKVWKKKGLKRQTRRVHMRPRPKAAGPVIVETDSAGRATAGDAHDQDGHVSDDDENDKAPHSPSKKAAAKSGRKISAAAHTNYCKLKIKNQNSKAKGRSRFSRRK